MNPPGLRAKLIASLKYRNLRYTKNHPLRIPRVSLLLEFLFAMDLIDPEEVVESRSATDEEVLLFHSREYLEALKEADRCRCVPVGAREKFNIGNYENPVSEAMLRGSLLATGSSVQAVELFLEGNVPFNPAGGMHHAFPSKANGFCFINDPGVALLYLLRKGFKKILYVDLDAHHCDGVQDFFYEDDRVFVLSIHQDPSYSFPFNRGFLSERGKGRGKGFNLNVPLPKGVNDSEYLFILEKVCLWVREVFNYDALVLQLGTDPLLEDPLSKWQLSNAGFHEAFRTVREILGGGIYLGGGGYNPLALARAWTLIWCEISGREIPERITQSARKVLKAVEWEDFDEEEDRSYLFEYLKDRFRGGEIREEIKEIAAKVKALIYS
jgi:acetoin utilization protein AcuC